MGFVATCWSPAMAGLLEAVGRAAAQFAAAGLGPGLDESEALVEARLDLLASPAESAELAALARAAGGRLLATCRPTGQGAPAGRGDRLALLASAGREGAAAVDLEAEGTPPGPARLALPGLPDTVRLVLSSHASAPLAAPEAARCAFRLGQGSPDVVKLAAPVSSAGEALDLARAGHDLPSAVGWAPVPLGPAGAWLRILANRPSSLPGRPWSALGYVAAGDPLPGPGGPWQPTLQQVLCAQGALPVARATAAVFGIFGWPLAATWSPLLHGALFRERLADAVLVPLPVRDVPEAGRLAAALKLAGAAVTAPHKAASMALASRLPPSAVGPGAINTLRRDVAGEFAAESFDGDAAAEALAAVAGSLEGAHVLVLGGGGTARCVAVSLGLRGARVTLAVRRPEDVGAATAWPGSAVVPWSEQAGVAADLLVNATPLGGLGEPSLELECLPWRSLRGVLDCVTTPPLTSLVREAQRRGLGAADGLAMLARQAAAQQAFWGPLPGVSGGESLPPLSAARTESLLRDLASSGVGP